jgi:hypothetical protein
VIFARRPDARSRLTTAYMTGNFTCGAIASAASAAVWSSGGWGAVCALGGACAGTSLAVWTLGRLGLTGDVRPGARPLELARAHESSG